MGVLPVVGDAENGCAATVAEDIIRCLLPQRAVQPLKRLIQQQKSAAKTNRPADGHPPPHSAGQLTNRLAEAAGEAQFFKMTTNLLFGKSASHRKLHIGHGGKTDRRSS